MLPPTIQPPKGRGTTTNVTPNETTERPPVTDPVAIIGSGVLGAFGQYLFTRLRRAWQGESHQQKYASNGLALSELIQMNARLKNLEGTMTGLLDRVELLESRGGSSRHAITP